MNRSYPSIHLRLTPHFDAHGAASGLTVCLELPHPNAQLGQPLLAFKTSQNNVPSSPLRECDIAAFDAQGPLQVLFVNGPSDVLQTVNFWCMSRRTEGNLRLVYRAFARDGMILPPLGIRVDLFRDQQGLLGAGTGFLPRYLSSQRYRNVVEWTLPPDVPAGTKCVSTFGKGPGPVSHIGPAQELYMGVYMVGPIRSYPAFPRPHIRDLGFCHWFGSLPRNIYRDMTRYNEQLVPRMVGYFQAPGETWRVFIRKGAGRHGAFTLHRCCILQYTEEIEGMPDHLLTHLFTHELVHNFSNMDAEVDGYDNKWFIEGLAEYYAALLPYRFGLRNKDYMVRHLNRSLQAYFTSPRLRMNLREAVAGDWYAAMVPYKRGCAYLMWLDGVLRRRYGSLDLRIPGPLDAIVIRMSHSRNRNRPFRAQEWIHSLGRYLDLIEIGSHFWSMLAGTPLDFDDLWCHDLPYRLVRCEHRILDFGFDITRIPYGRINGVVLNSPADLAGLHDGDVVTWTSDFVDCMGDPAQPLSVTIRRGNGVDTIQYLPRSEQKIWCWELEM